MIEIPPRGEALAKERRLFGLLLLLQAGITAWLILSRRLMRTHDTLFEYQVQYLFLAHACQNPGLALWFPCTVHGVVSNWLANFQGGLLQNILLLAGGVPEGTNMIPVFYLGKFLEEFILLVGAWRLARHYYASPYSRFFVGVAVLGSSYWASHFSFNLKLFYGVPLILSLIHDFLRDGTRRSLWLAGLFAALQFTGTITYIPLLTGLALLAYLAVHAALFPSLWAARIRSLRFRPSDVALVLVIGIVLGSIFVVFTHGGAGIRHYRPGRGADAGVSLDSFLTYAGTLSPGRYADLFLGATPSLDYSLYSGAGVPILALLALLARPGKAVLHWVLCILLLTLFSMGFLSLVAAAAFEIVPPLRFFRYVSLAAPLVKVFLIFLAGHGVQALVDGSAWKTGAMTRLLLPVLLILGGLGLALLFGIKGDDIPAILGTGGSGLANRRDASSNSAVALSGAFTLLLGGILLLAAKGSLRAGPCIALLLGLETVDVFRWKISLLREETVPLNEAQVAVQEIRPLPFIARRSGDYDASDRFRRMKPLLAEYGTQYDLIDAVCHVDPPLSRFTFNYWMQPFESLVQALEGNPPDRNLEGLPILRKSWTTDPGAKLLGITADKLQVFREAHVPGSDQAVADVLHDPRYKGDLLLLSASPTPSAPVSRLSPELLSQSERLDVRPEVLHFDMNVLQVKVQVPAGLSGAWLFYSDGWDPGWTATVNDRPTTVERAFLAYKAVRLDPGTNMVTFRFEDALRSRSYRIVGLASLVSVVWIAGLALNLFGVLPIERSR
jgi:hypothetical protein